MIAFSLPVQQMIVCGVALMLIVLLLFDKFKPAFIFFSAVLVFLLLGILQTGDFLDALANQSILSIFLLIFITAGIKEHFNLIDWLDHFFGKAKTGKGFILRMSSGVAVLSSFLNNTPIVALFMPYVYQWGRKHNISPSKLLIPLSYAAIAGGMMTVVGTSTNLVLKGLAESKNAVPPGFLDYLLPGLTVSIAGILFLYLFGEKLLPNRSELLKSVKRKPREYLVEVRIQSNASIIGQSILEARLRNLKGVYLFEIIRKEKNITPVNPDEVIQKGDALVFAGETKDVIELLEREKDFTTPYISQEETGMRRLNMMETVIPFNSELIGSNLKEIEFRENYDAAVVAIHRNGEKLSGKIGEIILQAGDLLLIVPGKTFRYHIDNRQSLYLVSVVQKISHAHPMAKKGFLGLLVILLGILAFGQLNLFLILLILTAYMVASKLLNIRQIKRQLDVDLLIILVSSLAFSTALIQTGTAQLLAEGLMPVFLPLGNLGVVLGIYVITLILTSIVTHVAAVSIIFPIGYAIGLQMPGLDLTALFVAIAFAASASFHSPFSYQTNMMIYGPGGYKFKDFIKIGVPFTLLYSILALAFILLYYKI